MDILKSLLITIIILLVVAVIPILIYDTCDTSTRITLEDGKVSGPFFYLLKIYEEDKNVSETTTQNISNMAKEWQNFVYARTKMVAPMILYVGTVISILLFVLAFVTFKTTKAKVWTASLVASGIISFIIYYGFYFRVIFVNTIVYS